MRARANLPRGGVARRWALLATLGLALAVAAATAQSRTRLVAVRVGVHSGYARVVLETDRPARHDLAKLGDADWFVYLGAMSTPRTIPAREPGAPSLEIASIENGATAVRIQTPTPVRVETQVLESPPRLVLDLRPTPSEAAPETHDGDGSAQPAPEAPAPEADQPAEPSAPEATAPAPARAPAEAPVPVTESDASSEAASPETPPPVAPEAAPVPESPESQVDEQEAPGASEPPPVATAPPLAPGALPPAISLEPRSLATGIALGFALALFAFATRRPRSAARLPEQAVTAPASAEIEAVPVEPVPEREVAEAPAPAPPAEPAEDLHDFVRMHERIDARLADARTRLEAIAERQDRLDSQGRAHDTELAAQRVAITRLKLALRPAGVAPRQSPERAGTPTR